MPGPETGGRSTWPFAPNKFRLVGSTKLTLTNRATFGNENPCSITPFTTLNVVVTPQMPRARTVTAIARNPFSRRRRRNPTRRSWTRRSVTLDVARHDQTTVAAHLSREAQQERCKGGARRGLLAERAGVGRASGKNRREMSTCVASSAHPAGRPPKGQMSSRPAKAPPARMRALRAGGTVGALGAGG